MRRTGMMGTSRALAAAAVVAALLMSGCTTNDATDIAGGSEASSDGPSREPTSSTIAPSVATPSATRFEVYTHCGVESTRINDAWWHAKPALYNKPRNGPPIGWGDPYQTGTLTMLSDDRAVFEALGQQVVFVPAPDDQPVRTCD